MNTMSNFDRKISVIMGVFNCEKTVSEAIRSIQDQTYPNWELIICDDGSYDCTLDVVRKMAEEDSRLIVISNPVNVGLNRTLNHCLEYASGEYIARMDGDDICDKRRFAKQVQILGTQDEYKICSSAMYFFDEHGIWGRNHVTEYPTKEDVVIRSPICHAPVMMTRECMDSVKGYAENPHLIRVEDVDLWIRLYAAGYKCHNIDEPLYGMRNDQNALKRRKFKYRINSVYARINGCRLFNLSGKYYIKAMRPLLYGLVPARLRDRIKRKRSQ